MNAIGDAGYHFRGVRRCVIVVEDDDMLRKALKMEFQGSFRTLAAADAINAAALIHVADLVAVVSDF